MKEISQLLKEWKPVLEAEGIDAINNAEKAQAVAQILENTHNSAVGYQRKVGLNEDAGNVTGNVDGYDPVLISMTRRTMPSLIAFDMAGVQPMSGPTGKVFAMRAYYGNDPDTGAEAFYQNAPNTAHTGKYTTAQAENLGTLQQVDSTAPGVNPVVSATPWPEMTMKVDSITVEAQSRALKAVYTDELMEDLKNLHGLNADSEISRILVGEIRAEMNRELTETINVQAVVGAAATTTPGTFDLNADTTGRWSVEKHKELMTFLYRESAVVAAQTRRGQANFIICSADIAATLIESSLLDTSFTSQNLTFDGIGVTFAGILAGRYKLYIDAYAAENYITLGYKGSEKYDAGIFWCPYVGIERRQSIQDTNFQPQIGYKTRYGITHNPLTSGAAQSNVYFRRFLVTSL